MADLTVQFTGALSFQSANALGDSFANNGRRKLVIKNDDTSDHQITIDSQTPCNFGFDHDLVESVPAGSTVIVGPFEPVRFNDIDGNVSISYDDVTSVTVAVISI